MKTIDLPIATSKIFPLLVILLTLFMGSAGAWAKPDTGHKNTALDITKDSLQAKIEAINTRQGLDEALKTKVLSIINPRKIIWATSTVSKRGQPVLIRP